MNPEARWVARASVVQMATLQKNSTLGISGVVRAAIDAYRLFDAIEAFLQGEHATLTATLNKVQREKWFGVDPLQALAAAQIARGVSDPFTALCVAAYKQAHDGKYLAAGGVDPIIVGKIVARHEAYRIAQQTSVEVEARA